MSSVGISRSDANALARYLGEIRPFKDGDSAGAKSFKMRMAQSHYVKHKKTSSQASIVKSATGFNQALVKVVFNGGAKNAKALSDQIEYLTREKENEPTLNMIDSEIGDYAGEMDSGELADKLKSWTKDFKGNPRLGHTTHMVVSYPYGTDQKAAYDASLAFADAAFSSGIGGDCFDYVAVQHTDTKYPHTHFVIKNRGLYDDEWFSIRRDGEHNSDALRELQVETAADFGIELTATRRLERGIIEAPVHPKEFRLAQKEGREVVIRELSGLEAQVKAFIVSQHEETLRKVADVYSARDPEISNVLINAAAMLKNGEPIMLKEPIDQKTIEKTRDSVAIIEAQKKNILESISGVEKTIEKGGSPVANVVRQARLGKIKASVACYFPEKSEFQAYGDGEVNRDYQQDPYRYKQLPEKDRGFASERYEKAEKNIATRAHEDGIEPEKVLARYSLNDRVPEQTARDWNRDEVQDIRENRPETSEDQAKNKVEKFHDYVRDQFKTANQEIQQTMQGRGVFYEPELKREKEDALERNKPEKPLSRPRPKSEPDLGPGR